MRFDHSKSTAYESSEVLHSSASQLICFTQVVQADVVVHNPVVAGQQRFQEMVCKLLLMGFEKPEVQKALLVAHREGVDGGEATLLRAVECLTQSRDSAVLLS